MKYRLDAPLDELLDQAKAKFRIAFEPLRLGERELFFLQITNMSSYLESLAAKTKGGAGVELPLWARIWPTALPASLFVQKIPVRPGTRMLEIGTGVGVVGLFAAAAGHRVLLTDVNPEALLFTRINILKNGLEDRADVAKVDLTRDRLEEKFNLIVGCEVLYRKSVQLPLLAFLKAHIAPDPDAEIILALDQSRSAAGFFHAASQDFQVAARTFNLAQENGESKPNTIFRLKAKPHA